MSVREADFDTAAYIRPFAPPPEWYSDPKIYRREKESVTLPG